VSGIKKRLEALETAGRSGWARVHRIVQRLGQSESEALDGYGRERVGSDDLVIVRRIFSPERG
jgi:hypothetical protein